MELKGPKPAGETRFLRSLALAGLALAVFLRVFALADKPFWQDEAWLVLATGKPLSELLAIRAPVPIGFALAVKASSLLPGPPELALRLVPLLAGLATVAVLPLLAGALGADPRTQVVTLWLAAAAPALVNYSRELKHYEMDALFGAAFALLAVRLLGGSLGAAPAGGGLKAGIVVLAAAVPWFSFAAVFTVSAALVWGWCARFRDVQADVRRRWAAASAAFLISAAAVYLLFIRHQAANPRLRLFWGKELHRLDGLPLPLGLVKAAILVVAETGEFLFPWVWPAALGVAALGLVRAPRPGRSFLLWWSAITVLTAAAAVVSGRYVISSRLLLFAVPPLILAAALGLAEAGRLLRAPRALPLMLALVLSGLWSYEAVEHRLQPGGKAGFIFDRLPRLKEMVASVEARRGPGEPLYVTRRLARPFAVYAAGRLPDVTLEPLPPLGTRPAEHTGPLRQWLGTVKERGWILVAPRDESRVRGALRGAAWEVYSEAVDRGVSLWRIAPGGQATADGKDAAPGRD